MNTVYWTRLDRGLPNLYMPRRRIAFVVNNLGMMDIIAPPAVAALAMRAGWEADLFVYNRHPRRVTEAIREFAPDIVAYSVCSNESQDYVRINQALKRELPFFALFGGYHATFTPDYVQEDGVDALCRGEAYVSFPQFLERFGTDGMYDVENFSFVMPDGSARHNPLANLVQDFSQIPYPARDLVYKQSTYLRNNPAKPFMASRGCPYNCSYCYNSALNKAYAGKGRILCNKDVDYLIGEIRSIRDRFPLSFVRFSDDTFGANRSWLEEFTRKYRKEVGLPYACYVRANLVSEDYARLLREGGCHSVNMAIECGNEELRRRVLNRDMSNETILDAFHRLQKNGIRVMALNMLGLPDETEENVWETVRLNQQAKPDHAHICTFQPYPGTEAHAYCLDHGLLDPEDNAFDDLYTGWSRLNLSADMKQRLFVLHKMFPMVVDFPKTEGMVRLLMKTRRLNTLLEYFTRLYFGYFAYRNVYYKARIPLWVRLHGAISVLLTRNRI